MKKTLIPFILLLIFNLSCERDDICAASTPTTPRLLIEFFDVTSPEDLKSVPRLTVYGDSPNIPIPNDEDFSGAILIEPFEPERVYNTNSNSIKLPLKIGTENETTTTRFILERNTNLRLDTDETTESNIDIIEITYTNEFVYVSRACGYKSTFTNLSVTRIDDTDTWISNIDINEAIDRTVENENTVHVQIFH